MKAPLERDDLLPASATAFERAQSQTSARILDTDAGIIRRARTGAGAPEALLGHLGWERSVHHPTGDASAMRRRIDSAFGDHLAYGTPAALEDELSQDTGQRVRIVEYFEDPDLSWPDFLLQSEIDPGDAPPDLDAVYAAAILRKNVRDWPARVRTFVRQPAATMFFAAATSMAMTSRVLMEKPDLPGLHIGAGARVISQSRIVSR